VLTSYVVVVTGNHFWLDGVAAAMIVAAVLPVAAWLAARWGATAAVDATVLARPIRPSAEPNDALAG
jgi:hypothetical protein